MKIRNILIIITIWIIICINPKILFPIFLLFPLFKIFIILGLANAFMNSIYDDRRKNNKFNISNDFICGAVVSNAINENKK